MFCNVGLKWLNSLNHKNRRKLGHSEITITYGSELSVWRTHIQIHRFDWEATKWRFLKTVPRSCAVTYETRFKRTQIPSTVDPDKEFLTEHRRHGDGSTCQRIWRRWHAVYSENGTSIVMISATHRTSSNVGYNSTYVRLIPEGERSWKTPTEKHCVVESIGYSHECFSFPSQSYLRLEHGKVRNKSLRRG